MAVDVLVIGAGVIGLTTAIRAAEEGMAVRVVAADPPRETTSALAGAMVGPLLSPPGDRSRVWGQATIDELTTGPAPPGVRVARGRLAARPAGMLPPFAEEIPGFRPCDPAELPAGFGTGFWVELPLVDTPTYLDHLVERLRAAGGQLELGRVASLADAVVSSLLILLLGAVIVYGVGGYMALEGWSFLDALYMTISTLTTVGRS